MKPKPHKSLPINKEEGPSKRDVRLLTRNSVNGLITVAAAAEALEIPTRLAANRLGRLAKQGWVTHVMRGTYFVLPLEAASHIGAVAVDPWIVASVLFSPCYIGGWSAAEHFELTEQLFTSTFVVTAKSVRSSKLSILGNEFRAVRVEPYRLGEATSVWRGPQKVRLSDRELTIVDACASPDWVGGFRHLTDICRTYLESSEQNYDKLLKRAFETDKGAAYKRLGWLVQHLDPKASGVIKMLRRKLTTGTIRLDPAIRTTGKLNKDWGVFENISI